MRNKKSMLGNISGHLYAAFSDFQELQCLYIKQSVARAWRDFCWQLLTNTLEPVLGND